MTTIAIAPHETVWNLTNAGIAARCLHVVAELGVADAITDVPVGVDDLAAACGTDPDALDRVLRLLVSLGVFAKEPAGYTHTGPSQLLRSDHPASMRAFPRMMGMPIFLDSFARLDHAVRTGRPSLEVTAPGGLWDYLAGHDDEAAIFDQAMTGKAHADVAAVLDAFDFSPYRRIADIGGGRGHLIRAIVEAYPDSHGVLFDLREIAAAVSPGPRLDVVAGDFFTDPLPACDAYVLMNIVHDFDDHRAEQILTAVAHAGAASAATVLLVETVLPERPETHWANILDVIMLAITGGRERTQPEYDRLFGAAGLVPTRTVPTRTPFSIIEARVPRNPGRPT